jgi:hypothetical protein
MKEYMDKEMLELFIALSVLAFITATTVIDILKKGEDE